jgi:hypothetical protein
MSTKTTFRPLARGWYRLNQYPFTRVKKSKLEAMRRHRTNSGRPTLAEQENLSAQSASLRSRIDKLIDRSGRPAGQQPYIGQAPSAWEAMVRR